jgi:hypothetical protein
MLQNIGELRAPVRVSSTKPQGFLVSFSCPILMILNGIGLFVTRRNNAPARRPIQVVRKKVVPLFASCRKSKNGIIGKISRSEAGIKTTAIVIRTLYTVFCHA